MSVRVDEAPDRERGDGGGARPAGRWRRAAHELDDWMAARDYAGYDPHDFLNSPVVRRLTFGSRWIAVAWTQLGRRSPVQLRPLLRVPPRPNAKGLGLVLAAHTRLDAARDRSRIRQLVDRLARLSADGFAGPAWGYPFPWANRDAWVPAGTPSSVVTSFVAHALLDAADRGRHTDAGRMGEAAAAFVRRDLNRTPAVEGDGFCFSYTPLDRRAVHNANVLAASLLARVAARTGDAEMAADALRAARFSAGEQRPDGSWPYGLGRRNAWVDSFHTSYLLVGLAEIAEALGTDEFEPAIARGLEYWRETFLIGPAIAYYPGSAYPVDMHAVAHTILTLVRFRARLPKALETAERLAEWSMAEMRDRDGYFYYRRHRRWRNRVAYMRWVQAWMLRALAELAWATEGRTKR